MIGGKDFEGIPQAWDEETVTIETEPAQSHGKKKKKGRPEQEENADEPVIVIVPRKNIAVLRLYLDF